MDVRGAEDHTGLILVSEAWLEVTAPATTSVYLRKGTGRKQFSYGHPGGRRAYELTHPY